MKRFICAVISVFLIVSCIAGCETDKNGKSKINIVTTIFPQYDWTREILGEKLSDVNLTLLLDSGVDLHSYQPTAKDIVTVSSSDLFIYVGGESDEWVEEILEESTNKDMKKIALMDYDNLLIEETVEGMQETEEDDEDEDEEETEYDEHIWLSLKKAQTFCKVIAKTLGEIDSKNADYYTENADKYIEKLDALDKEYESVVGNSTQKTLIFADRFPFRYLTNDYGLNYFAAFKGCSAESEASFETISFLSNKVKETGVPCVIALEGSDGKIAKTVISTANDPALFVATLDSMQSITLKDVNSGKTYLDIAKSNLASLKKALT